MLHGAGGLALAGSAPRSMSGSAHQATPVAITQDHLPLWQAAWQNGIVCGTSATTWQLDDAAYAALVANEAAVLLTEDDLLWWRLKPTPDTSLDFAYADRFFDLAEVNAQFVLGAHLVWDEGFGDGWSEQDLWGLNAETATTLLYGTIETIVARYRGRAAGWIVVNEVIDAHESDGLRRDYPWYRTIGPAFIAESFRVAHAADPDAALVLNDFGFETDSAWDAAADRRKNALQVLDRLLAEGTPVHAFGIQAHLSAANFAENFDTDAYRQFLADLAARGVKIIISELDVLDDDLPTEIADRDWAIAAATRLYLETALREPAVASVITFGLSDRYTWLQEDAPREDGAARRPLPFDNDHLAPKPMFEALAGVLASAPDREPMWTPPRAG